MTPDYTSHDQTRLHLTDGIWYCDDDHDWQCIRRKGIRWFRTSPLQDLEPKWMDLPAHNFDEAME